MSSAEEEEEYVVEKILDKKYDGGVPYFLIKWDGWDDPADQTWEPVENLDSCPDLLKEFEAKWKAKKEKKKEKKDKEHRKDKSSSSYKDKDKELLKRMMGFKRGLEAEKIIGATDSMGEMMFLIKWKGSDEADLVPSREANLKCPQVVIKFYEQRLSWQASAAAAAAAAAASNGKVEEKKDSEKPKEEAKEEVKKEESKSEESKPEETKKPEQPEPMET